METGLHSSYTLWMAMAPIAALAAAVGLALVVKVRAAKDEVGGIADQLRPRAWRIFEAPCLQPHPSRRSPAA